MSEINKLAEIEYPNSKGMSDPYRYAYERKAYIKGYEKAQEWISVEDRLPKKQRHYLVVTKGGNISKDFFGLDYNQFDEPRKQPFVIEYTHWKNLPTPPKQ
tara:strand:- start:2353 stop:2655 length:303 start_codon:yes stop_codon:yes gene_type:complete